VTIATNMGRRGTDIKLGEGVVDVRGLFVLGTGVMKLAGSTTSCGDVPVVRAIRRQPIRHLAGGRSPAYLRR
jgi:hypothetical protein